MSQQIGPFHVVINEGKHVDTVAVVDSGGYSAFRDIDGQTNIAGEDHSAAFARAYIFAAAPELLEALESMIKFNAGPDEVDKARAAIAKATGRTK